MTQMPFPLATRNTDPATSVLAEAEHTASGRRQTHVRAVTLAVREHPGLVARELVPFTGLEYHETMRRLNDARRAGLVHQGPEKKHNGKLCVTWHPVEGGE